jgi:hypothetical protein
MGRRRKIQQFWPRFKEVFTTAWYRDKSRSHFWGSRERWFRNCVDIWPCRRIFHICIFKRDYFRRFSVMPFIQDRITMRIRCVYIQNRENKLRHTSQTRSKKSEKSKILIV